MKITSLLIAASVFSFALFGQPADKKKIRDDRTEIHRIAFISHELQLSQAEAQQFWPVYNKYQNDLKEIRMTSRLKNIAETISEKEMEENLLHEFDLSQKKLDLRKQYYGKFREILPVNKIAQLYKAENKFNAVLKRRMKSKNNKKKTFEKQ